jgi:ABC-type glycerol-3-phosphate transport system substrate-binding protein
MFVLYYNEDLFQRRGVPKPTADWDHTQYADAMRKLTFTEGDKKTFGGFARIDIFDRQYHVKAFGGHYVDPRDLTRTQLDQEAAQRALEWQYDRLWKEQSWGPIADRNRPWEPKQQQDGFAQGFLASLEDGLHQMLNTYNKATGFTWNIMHIPKGPAKRDSLVTTDSWGMWKETRARDATWEFMKFLISKDFYEQQVRIEGLLPSRKSVLETYIRLMRERFTRLPNFNWNVITDGLTRMDYLSVDEVFQCQADAARVVGEGMTVVFVNGEKPPSHFRDIAPQINQAAGACGVKYPSA